MPSFASGKKIVARSIALTVPGPAAKLTRPDSPPAGSYRRSIWCRTYKCKFRAKHRM